MTTDVGTREIARAGALYRIIWKWHFLAGLLVLAFMAITGIVNLFYDDLNEMLYSDRLNVPAAEQRLAYEQIAGAAQAAAGGRVSKVFVPEAEGRSFVFETQGREGPLKVAWVNPYTAEVLGVAEKEKMPLQFIERAHMSFTAGWAGRLVNVPGRS